MLSVNYTCRLLLLLLLAIYTCDAQEKNVTVYRLSSGKATFHIQQYEQHNYGISIRLGTDAYEQALPCEAEVIDGAGSAHWYHAPYSNVRKLGKDRFEAIATVTSAHGSVFGFTDTYHTTPGGLFTVDRTVKVIHASSEDKAFSTRLTFQQPVNTSMADLEFFTPGVWYKNNAYVNKAALASDTTDQDYWFREDRLPLPLFMVRQNSNNITFSVCHKDPEGDTFAGEDGLKRVTDERMKFAAVGMSNTTRPAIGLWYPGTEGARTGVFGFSTNKRWALRSHPVKDHFVQAYNMAMRISYEPDLASAIKHTWQTYYRMIDPPLYDCDLSQIYTDQISMLSEYWNVTNGVAGFPFSVKLSGVVEHNDFDFGFVGNQVANASLLIREGVQKNDTGLLSKGEQIAEWWARHVFAPSGAPRNWYDPLPATWRSYETYARVVADGFSGLLWAWNFESKRGVHHAHWLDACIQAGDWLLSHQGQDGSFPRAWNWRNNTVAIADKTNTSHLIPFLTDLYMVTGDHKYANAALAAGNYIYNNDYRLFKYVGGTPDNPNVPDKEAASLALRAFLALHDLLQEKKWLDAAAQTAYYYQTWIYCWRVPIPADDTKATYPKHRSSTGLSLIATTNNGADSYASVDAFNFYRMYLYTGDVQLKNMANILLYNTKQGVNWDRKDPIPGFGRPGMIEEAQGVIIPRGRGVGVYLPWQTFNMIEPFVLLWDVFGARSYDLPVIDRLSNKHRLHAQYSATRGFVKATPDAAH